MGTHETFIFLGYFTHILGVEQLRVFQSPYLLGKVESETQPWASDSTMKKS